MRPAIARLAGIAVAMATILGDVPAPAQEPANLKEAEAVFEQGVTLLNAGRYEEACPKFEAARALVKGVGVTLYLGECYAQTGRLATAWQQFTEAEEMATAAKDRRAAVAHARAERLWPSLSKLTIEVSSGLALAGLVITDDEVEVAQSSWNVARPVDPGLHRLRATAPGRERWEAAVEVPRDPQTVLVAVPPLDVLSPESLPPSSPVSSPSLTSHSPHAADAVAPASAAATTDAPLRGDARRAVAITLMGAGVVGLATGAAFGLDAKSKLDDSNSSGHCQPDDTCDPAGKAERSNALSSANASTALFVVGAACIAGGAVLYWVAPRTSAARISVVPQLDRAGGGLLVRGSL